MREARDVLFLGPPCTGTSFLVQAIGYLAIKQGLVVLYRLIFDVIRDFLLDEAVADQEKVLARYLKPDLLIVDAMGMKNLPRQSGEVLFEIIRRSDRGVLAVYASSCFGACSSTTGRRARCPLGHGERGCSYGRLYAADRAGDNVCVLVVEDGTPVAITTPVLITTTVDEPRSPRTS